MVDLRTKTGKASKVDMDKIISCCLWLSTKGIPSKGMKQNHRRVLHTTHPPCTHTDTSSFQRLFCAVSLRAQFLFLQFSIIVLSISVINCHHFKCTLKSDSLLPLSIHERLWRKFVKICLCSYSQLSDLFLPFAIDTCQVHTK